ncbi:MAG: peptidase superfamily protein [Candidatus Eremiobacteraeota bacterium]|nr:peptidase superfamily protein [Candidatus Eremiobacteraeota bacterium]
MLKGESEPSRVEPEMKTGTLRATLAAFGLCTALAACGGGGGGGSTGGGGTVPVTPTPLPTPTPLSGFVLAQGPVTLIPALNGRAGSDLLPGSADGVMLAQVPSTPTAPQNGAALTQFAVTVTENAGTSPSSVARSTASANSVLATRIADDRAARADGLRERAVSPDALRRAFAGVRPQAIPAAGSARAPRAAPGPLNTTRPFSIITSTIGNAGGCAAGSTNGPNGQYQCHKVITAQLLATGTHANIWIDQNSLNATGEFTNATADAQQIAADFDRYYATETGAFGPAWFPNTQPTRFTNGGNQCDVNGTPLPVSAQVASDFSGSTGQSVDVVITDALAGTGEGGYYYIVDEFPQEVWNCSSVPKPVSNNTSMFVLTADDYTGLGGTVPAHNESYWLNTDVPRGMSHELQHLLHAHDKVIFAELSGTTPGFDAAFIDEGCSMLAEDLATDPAPGQHLDTPRYSYTYLLQPSLFSLTAFTGYQPNPLDTSTNPPYGWYSNTAGSYGQAYLFSRYLYDRFGPASLKAIYASTASGVGPVVAAAGGEPFAQLYEEFVLALSAQSSPVAQSPYAFSSAVVLRGAVDVPSVRLPPLNVRHLVFGGPQPPQTFANNLPTGFLNVAPGLNAQTFVIDGATLFLPASNAANGAAIVVTATGVPPSYQGGLVQGALPTPTPSSQ